MHAAKLTRRTMLGFALSAATLHAQSLQHVTYLGGTALQGTNLHGKVSISPTDSLVFESTSKLAIPYDHVLSYESTTRKTVPVGLLTEGIWRLLAPWPEDKQLSLSYRDADDHPQVVLFTMSRGDEALLVEVLKTRVPRSPAPRVPPLTPHPSAVAQARATEP